MKISIIGAAGTVGSCTAFVLASHKLADEIVLMDKNEILASGHAMDINASTVAEGKNILVRAGDMEKDLAGTEVVIVTAGVHFGFETPLTEVIATNIPIIGSIVKQIEMHCPDAVVIIASNPLDPLTYAACELTNMNRKKFIGYNLNDTIRFKMITAEVLGVGPYEIEAIVMGEHPGDLVPLFSAVKVNGQTVSVDADTQGKIKERLQNYLKTFISVSTTRTAGWTSAAGIASIVKAVKNDSRQLFSCSAGLKGEYGYDGLSMGVPALLGKAGIHEILEWKLSAVEQNSLKHAAGRIQSSTEIAKKAMDALRF